MSWQWMYKTNGRLCGPVTWNQLQALARAGRVKPTDLVRPRHQSLWQRAGDVQADGADEPAPSAPALALAEEPLPQSEPSHASAVQQPAVAPILPVAAAASLIARVDMMIQLTDDAFASEAPAQPAADSFAAPAAPAFSQSEPADAAAALDNEEPFDDLEIVDEAPELAFDEIAPADPQADDDLAQLARFIESRESNSPVDFATSATSGAEADPAADADPAFDTEAAFSPDSFGASHPAEHALDAVQQSLDQAAAAVDEAIAPWLSAPASSAADEPLNDPLIESLDEPAADFDVHLAEDDSAPAADESPAHPLRAPESSPPASFPSASVADEPSADEPAAAESAIDEPRATAPSEDAIVEAVARAEASAAAAERSAASSEVVNLAKLLSAPAKVRGAISEIDPTDFIRTGPAGQAEEQEAAEPQPSFDDAADPESPAPAGPASAGLNFGACISIALALGGLITAGLSLGLAAAGLGFFTLDGPRRGRRLAFAGIMVGLLDVACWGYRFWLLHSAHH